MRDPIILLVHLIATLARLMGPGGLRSVVAESVLVKQQLLILNRSRHRAPNLCASDRILAGVCALFMRPARVIRSAIVLRPSTILEFHRALRTRKYRWLFSPTRRRTGPQGPSNALVDAIVDMKRRNPRRRPRRRRCSWPPLPRSPRRPSLASRRCRCRRPRTVCVVPRKRSGVPGGVSRERTRPGNGDPMSASGPPSVRW